MEEFRKYVQPFPDTVEPMTREQFASLLSVSHHYAPGPDGIVYDAWTHSGDVGVGILCACYSSMLVDPCVPECLHCSLMTFIPKGDVNDHGASVQAKPDELRPLSLSNTDQKLLALAANQSLVQACSVTVGSHQRGLMKGRQLTDNVLEVDAYVDSYLLCRSMDACVAQVLLDMKAAFPSAAWNWIWFVLDAMGAPTWVKTVSMLCMSAALHNSCLAGAQCLPSFCRQALSMDVRSRAVFGAYCSTRFFAPFVRLCLMSGAMLQPLLMMLVLLSLMFFVGCDSL